MKGLFIEFRYCHDCRAMTKVIRQLCADVQTPLPISEDTGALAVRKPKGSLQPQTNLEGSAEEKKIQRLERAMQLVEASNCLVRGSLHATQL